MKRLSKFFSEEELIEYLQSKKNSSGLCNFNERTNLKQFFKITEFAVQLCNATLAWEKFGASILSGLNLDVERGKLVAVVGPIGSGKSSLLHTLCGEMSKCSGSVFVNDVKFMAYSFLLHCK